MSICKNCGFQIPDSSKFCPGCGAKKELFSVNTETVVTKAEDYVRTKTDDYIKAANEGPEKSMPKLSNAEQLVKRYECAQVKHPRCKAYLSVTNKRVIFHGSSSSSVICKEVNLESVSGLDCFRGMDVKIGMIILGLLMAIGGLIATGEVYNVFPCLVIIALGVLLVVNGFKKTYVLSVFSNKANGSPISVGAGARGLVGNAALYTLTCYATTDTALMIKDLGALVLDLQTMGDNAIPLWKK